MTDFIIYLEVKKNQAFMDFSTWLNNFSNFFKMQYNYAFIVELIMVSLGAILSIEILNFKNKTKYFIFKFLDVLFLFGVMTFLCALVNSFSNDLSPILPYLNIFSIVLPGIIYIGFKNKSNLKNTLIKMFLFKYLCCHRNRSSFEHLFEFLCFLFRRN